MGLLDGMLGGQGAQRGGSPGLGSTVVAGLALALLVKAVKNHQASGQAQTGGQPAPSQSMGGPGGGLAGGGLGGLLGGGLGGLLGGGGGGGLGGLLGGGSGAGGLGGLMGALGGAGGLGALVNQFQQSGFGGHAESWLSNGPNQAIAPNEVASALGEGTVAELQQRTGLPRDSLLSTLAHELPEALNQASPQGRLPSDQELQQLAGSG